MDLANGRSPGGVFVVRVTLNPERRQVARDWAEEIHRSIAGYGPSYTGLETPDRYYAGGYGQEAFAVWCESRLIRYEATSRTDGKSDEQDFFIWTLDGRKRSLNVKNSLHPYARKMMRPVEQERQRGPSDLYLGCTSTDLDTEVEVTMHGFITHADWVEKRTRETVRIDTYSLRLTELPITMDEFYKHVEKTGDPNAIWLAEYDAETQRQEAQ